MLGMSVCSIRSYIWMGSQLTQSNPLVGSRSAKRERKREREREKRSSALVPKATPRSDVYHTVQAAVHSQAASSDIRRVGKLGKLGARGDGPVAIFSYIFSLPL